jgi:hypothetical protein
VSPLQAVTLAAAAAGCTLEPIVAAKEDTDFENKPAAIIGYRVVLDKKPNSGFNDFSGLPTSQAAAAQVDDANSALSTAQKALNNERMRADKTVEGAVGDVTVLDPTGVPSNHKAPVALAASNWVAHLDPQVNQRGQSGPEQQWRWAAHLDPLANQPAPTKAPDANRSYVRIYALGSILSGSKEEIEEKKVHLQDLVTVAMRKTESDPVATSSAAPGTTANNRAPESAAEALPELSFHLELRALVVKGTAAQHEIIEQVMKVLKENEKPWWPQPATTSQPK